MLARTFCVNFSLTCGCSFFTFLNVASTKAAICDAPFLSFYSIKDNIFFCVYIYVCYVRNERDSPQIDVKPRLWHELIDNVNWHCESDDPYSPSSISYPHIVDYRLISAIRKKFSTQSISNVVFMVDTFLSPNVIEM